MRKVGLALFLTCFLIRSLNFAVAADLIYGSEYENYGDYLSGEVALKQGDSLAASVYFKRALKTTPDNKLIQQKLLAAYLLQGSVEKALELNARLSLQQKMPMAELLSAIYCFRKTDFKAVLASAENPDMPLLDNLALSILKAWAFYGLGHSDKAVAYLSKFTQQGPEEKQGELSSTLSAEMSEKVRQLFRPLLFYHMALLSQDEDPKKAQYYFEQALSRYSGSLQDLVFYRCLVINYASLLHVQKNNKASHNLLKQAMALYPGDIVLAQLAVRVANNRIIFDKVFGGLGECSSKSRKANYGAAASLVNISSFTHYLKLEGADKLYASFASFLAPNNMGARFQYASLLSDEAMKQKQELQLDIRPYSVYYCTSQLQKALWRQEAAKPYKAIRILERLRRQAGTAEHSAALATYMLADIYVNLGQLSKAALAIDSLINKQCSRNWFMYYQAGIVFARLGNLAKAFKYFDKSLSLAPDKAELLNYYGYVLLQNNTQLDRALSMLLKANKLDKNNGYILDSLGWAYYLMTDYSQSLIYLQKAVQICPFESEILEHLGDLYWKLGQQTRAIYEWRHALDSTKNKADIEKLKIKLKHGLIDRPLEDQGHLLNMNVGLQKG